MLDDVWDKKFEKRFIELVPENRDGSCVIVTSRIQETKRKSSYSYRYQTRLLDDKESWELLQRKVFGEGECPPLLVKSGNKIANNCEGLPLLIVSIATLLFEKPFIEEYWKEVAEMQNSVFEDACVKYMRYFYKATATWPKLQKLAFFIWLFFLKVV